jgi:hypothetical protein
MADEADLAFESEQRHLIQALAAQRRAGGRLQPIGHCHYCESTELIADRLFCDAHCAADWEYEDAVRRKVGLPARGTRALH